jgi:hypothetical protein
LKSFHVVCCLSIALSASIVFQIREASAAPSTWSVTQSPNMGSGANYLEGVSCTSSKNCVAVGSYFTSNNYQTLVETSQGASWSVTPSPNKGSGINRLYGVSCTTTTSCVAVGTYVKGEQVSHTLVEIWNGSTWSVGFPRETGQPSRSFLVAPELFELHR